MLSTFNLENADKEVSINSEQMNQHIKRMADSNYLGDTKYMHATRRDFDTKNNTMYQDEIDGQQEKELFDTQFKNTYFQNSF